MPKINKLLSEFFCCDFKEKRFRNFIQDNFEYFNSKTAKLV